MRQAMMMIGCCCRLRLGQYDDDDGVKWPDVPLGAPGPRGNDDDGVQEEVRVWPGSVRRYVRLPSTG